MAIVTCGWCGAKNRVDERVTVVGKTAVCGRCGAGLQTEGGGGSTQAADDWGATRSAQRGGGQPPASDSRRAASAESEPKAVTDSTFARDVIEESGSRPVLLDCWAEWCGPCRTIAPALDALAAESAGRYRVAKLNVDENPQTAAALGIRSIPTLFIYKDGRQVERIVGAQPKQVLAERLSAHI